MQPLRSRSSLCLVVLGILVWPAAASANRDPMGYADGFSLYEYTRSSPVTHTDPQGTEAVVTDVPGNTEYGDWKISQTNRHRQGTTRGKEYKSTVEIVFTPDKDEVCCDEISFIQIARLSRPSTGKTVDPPGKERQGRMTAEGWWLDRRPARAFPWYGYNNKGTPTVVAPGSAPTPYKVAKMTDGPQSLAGNRRWQFVTTVICKAGDDEGKVYGHLSWGFTADANGRLTSTPPTSSPR